MNPTPYICMSGQEFHCWNLVERVYSAELGITVQNYDGVCDSLDAVCGSRAGIISVTESLRSEWVRVCEPAEFDLIDIRHMKMPHVGIFIGGERMLHKAGRMVRISGIGGGEWKSRILGYYRHPALIA